MPQWQCLANDPGQKCTRQAPVHYMCREANRRREVTEQHAAAMSTVVNDGAPPEDTKYIVFKRDEFWAWFHNTHMMMPDKPEDRPTPHKGDQFRAALVGDAVVIRRQDYFAGPALDFYADQIIQVITLTKEFLGSIGVPVEEMGLGNLQAAADFFHGQAVWAREQAHKYPD